MQLFLLLSFSKWKVAIYVKLLCLCSSFADIFDVDHFIDVLHDEVSIVKELPSDYSWSTREYYATGIRATRIKTAPLQATADWYIENVLPVIQRYVNTLSPDSAMLPPLHTHTKKDLFYQCSNCFSWIVVISILVNTNMTKRIF